MQSQVGKKYSLGLDNLQGAVDAVCGLLGMTPCEGSGNVAENARTHGANLTGAFCNRVLDRNVLIQIAAAGTFYGGIPVLCRALFGLDAKHGVTLKIAVRSKVPQVTQMLTNAIR